jgi:hypothetical protein
MKPVRTIPRLGALAEMFAFYCVPCNRAETIEHRGAGMSGEGDESLTTNGLQFPMVDLFTGGMISPCSRMQRRLVTCYRLLHRWHSWRHGRKRLREPNEASPYDPSLCGPES